MLIASYIAVWRWPPLHAIVRIPIWFFFLSTFFLLFHFLQFRWAALRSVCCYYSQWLCEYTNALLETIFNTACCLLIRERWCSALFTPPNGLYDSLIELNEAQLFHCHSAQTHSAHIQLRKVNRTNRQNNRWYADPLSSSCCARCKFSKSIWDHITRRMRRRHSFVVHIAEHAYHYAQFFFSSVSECVCVRVGLRLAKKVWAVEWARSNAMYGVFGRNMRSNDSPNNHWLASWIWAVVGDGRGQMLWPYGGCNRCDATAPKREQERNHCRPHTYSWSWSNSNRMDL